MNITKLTIKFINITEKEIKRPLTELEFEKLIMLVKEIKDTEEMIIGGK